MRDEGQNMTIKAVLMIACLALVACEADTGDESAAVLTTPPAVATAQSSAPMAAD